MGDDRLTGRYDNLAAGMFHVQCAPQHVRVLIEVRRLAGLDPARRTPHVRDADLVRLRVHAPDDFINELWFITDRSDARRFLDELQHGAILRCLPKVVEGHLHLNS